MRIVIQSPGHDEEESAVISVRNVTERINRAVSLLKSPDDLTVYSDEQALLLPVADVFYVESVDLKTFVYAEKAVYRSRLKLYEVGEILSAADFLRASKQLIVNVRKIRSVAPAERGRFSAKLLNGETVIISRQYVQLLKARFGL
jgi:DNA-binding LytR/AlgR family response regulator